ncbi:MAG: tRNA pseudouridine(38-40) synthase TruA [Planctomycetaceae bacterium]
MRTIRLLVAYDGTAFHGWARQRDPSVRTIEGALGEALGGVLREEVRLSVAGRTDAGVHARGQVVSFATSSRVAPERLQAAVNGRLAPEVVVRHAASAPEGFDARFSASAREYRYVVDTAAVPDPFIARFVWHRPGAMSVPAMRAGARALVGEHDFTTFCRHPGADRSTVRDLQRLTVSRDGERVVFSLRANAFLHQMVRSIVGTLVVVGEGRIAPEVVASALAARDRSRAAPVAPPQGLTLERVVYGRRREERRAGRSLRP